MSMNGSIKRLKSNKIYENPWMKVREDIVLFPDGHEGIFSVVERGDFALIIPFEDNCFYLVKQYRYSIGKSTWEFPQGRHEENPKISGEELARLELKEETGLKAKHFKQLGILDIAPGYSNQKFMVFLATELTITQAHPDSTEAIEDVKKMPIATFEEMINSGKITNAVTVSAYGLLKAQWSNKVAII